MSCMSTNLIIQFCTNGLILTCVAPSFLACELGLLQRVFSSGDKNSVILVISPSIEKIFYRYSEIFYHRVASCMELVLFSIDLNIHYGGLSLL